MIFKKRLRKILIFNLMIIYIIMENETINNVTDTENMTSQIYLDSMNHLQELYKKYELENQKLKDKNNDYKKKIICLYGSVNVLYSVLSNGSEVDIIVYNLIEGLVIYLNEIMEEMGTIVSL